MPPEPSESLPDPSGCGLAAAYGGAFLCWYTGASVLIGVIGGSDFISSTAGLCLLVTVVGAGGVWIGDRLRRLFRWTPAETWGLGAGPPRPRLWAAAALGGLSLGVVGGWLAESLGPPLKELLRWPADSDALATLGGALVEGPLGWRALFVLVVVLVGPLFEELIFRGAMWRSLRKRGVVTTVLVTSLAFALYHADPAQAVGVLPLAVFLGVLRQAGALLPCLLAHAVNNALATVLALTFGLDAETSGSLALLAALCGVVAFALAVSCSSPGSRDPGLR